MSKDEKMFIAFMLTVEVYLNNINHISILNLSYIYHKSIMTLSYL